MKNLQSLFDEAINECNMLDIPYGNIVDCVVNTRAKSRWGQCRKVGDSFLINISSILLDDSVNDRATLETILHEIIHTCPGCMNHGVKWKRYAELLAVFGYNITRCSSVADKGIDKDLALTKYKYRVTCERCGCSSYYSRATKVVRNLQMGNIYGRMYCNKCKSIKLLLETL